jgi:Fe2+ transport system protein B
LSSELRASAEQLEATNKELAAERQNFFYLNRALEEVVEQVQRREQAKWRRALSLLLTIVLSAVVGAASFAVFLWLYYRGVITLG